MLGAIASNIAVTNLNASLALLKCVRKSKINFLIFQRNKASFRVHSHSTLSHVPHMQHHLKRPSQLWGPHYFIPWAVTPFPPAAAPRVLHLKNNTPVDGVGTAFDIKSSHQPSHLRMHSPQRHTCANFTPHTSRTARTAYAWLRMRTKN
jgi:hypothetical protein